MNCDQIRDLFSDLMDGEFPEAPAREAEAHMASCASCAREWASFRRAVDAVRGLPQRSAPAGFAESVRENLQRERLLAEPRPSVILPLWRRPAFLGKALAAAAVLVIAVHMTPFRQTAPALPERLVGTFDAQEKARPMSRPSAAAEPVSRGLSSACSKDDARKAAAPAKAPAPEPSMDAYSPGATKEQSSEPAEANGQAARTVETESLKKDDTFMVFHEDANAPEEAKEKNRGEPAVLLAWVMPSGDPGAADRVREAFGERPMGGGAPAGLEAARLGDAQDQKSEAKDKESRVSALSEGVKALEEFRARRGEPEGKLAAAEELRSVREHAASAAPERRQAESGQAKEGDKSKAAPAPVRVLSFRVRAADLPAVQARLSALGARPAVEPPPPPMAPADNRFKAVPAPAAAPAKDKDKYRMDEEESWVILTVLLSP